MRFTAQSRVWADEKECQFQEIFDDHKSHVHRHLRAWTMGISHTDLGFVVGDCGGVGSVEHSMHLQRPPPVR